MWCLNIGRVHIHFLWLFLKPSYCYWIMFCVHPQKWWPHTMTNLWKLPPVLVPLTPCCNFLINCPLTLQCECLEGHRFAFISASFITGAQEILEDMNERRIKSLPRTRWQAWFHASNYHCPEILLDFMVFILQIFILTFQIILLLLIAQLSLVYILDGIVI